MDGRWLGSLCSGLEALGLGLRMGLRMGQRLAPNPGLILGP